MINLKEKYSLHKLYENFAYINRLSINSTKHKKRTELYLADSIHATLKLSDISIEKKLLTKIIKNNNISSKCYSNFSPKDSLVIRNTINAYKKIPDWTPYSSRDLQEAYKILTVDMDDIHDLTKIIEDINTIQQDSAACDDNFHKVVYGVIVFCEFLKYDLSESGRLSRLWLNVSLSKISKKFVLSSFEKMFYKYDKKFKAATDYIESGKYFEVASIIINLIMTGVTEAEKKIDISKFIAMEREIDEDLYDEAYEQQRVKSVKSKSSHKQFNKVFNNLSHNTKLNEGELRELFDSLSHLWEPSLYLAHYDLEYFVSILEKYHTDSKIDMLEFLYILQKCQVALDEHREEKRKHKLGKTLNSLDDTKEPIWKKYERCCIEAHNRYVETGYKGNGQNSPRSIMQNNCKFLKEKQISLTKFGRYCRAFEETLSKSEKSSELPTKNIPCPYAPQKKGTIPYCKKEQQSK